MKLKSLAAFAFLLFASYLLTSCSWVSRFYISNMTDTPVNIEVTLKKIDRGFPIFTYNSLSRYELLRNGSVRHHQVIYITPDFDEQTFSYKYELPPNHAVSIGALSNDHYKSYDQYFINDRVFNLERIVLSYGEKTLEIVPETFDDYFKVTKRGGIYCTLR